MSSRIIASGGTGQHGLLAYLRLCVLCRDFMDLRNPGDKFVPHIYVLDKDKGGKGTGESHTAAEMLSDVSVFLGVRPIFIDPTPLLSPEDSRTNTFEDLMAGSELLSLLFSAEQSRVRFRQGNFGHAAVGASVYYAKLLDTVLEEGAAKNRDPEYSAFERQVAGAANQRIVHIGSTVGGTGSGVMPALLARLAGIKTENHHLAIPFLEWFNLSGRDEATRLKAEQRNKTMRRNRSSGLAFYLKNLQRSSAVLPIGCLNANKDRYIRVWDDDYNQTAQEAAVHLGAALAMWEFFHVEKPFASGMYAFTPDNAFEIPGISKVGDFTLLSVLSANLTLIRDMQRVADYLENPPDTRSILFGMLRDKFTPPIIRALDKEERTKLAKKIEDKIVMKTRCAEWLRSLDDVDSSLKECQAISGGRGFEGLQSLFPETFLDHKPVEDAIYAHLVARAKTRLSGLHSAENLTSANRLLPEYSTVGIKPPPRPQGRIAPIDDTLYITQLYTVADIAPQSIPSPLGITHYVKEVCFDKGELKDEESRTWFERYLLLVKGLVGGALQVESISLSADSGLNFSLEKIVREIPESEDASWKSLKGYYRLKLKTETQLLIMGASSPKTFLFPAMSAKEDAWRLLKERTSGMRDAAAERLIAAWCAEIDRWDRTQKSIRPGWFLKMQEMFPNKSSGMIGFSWHDAKFPVVWGDKTLALPVPKVETGAAALAKESWDRVAEIFGAKTFWFKDGNLYSEAGCAEQLVNDDMLDTHIILDTCLKVVNGDGVFVDSILENINADKAESTKVENVPYTIVWVDIKEKELPETTISLEDGVISVVMDKSRIVFCPKKYHGIRPETVGVTEVVVFQESEGVYKLPDLPVKMKYIPLVLDDGLNSVPSATGETLTYSIHMKGRNRVPLNITVYPDRRKGAAGEIGTILLWPNFIIDEWKAYYLYRDGEESFRKLGFRAILHNQSDKNQPWMLTDNIRSGHASAITLDKTKPTEGDDTFLSYSHWINKAPKCIVIFKGGKEAGILSVRLKKSGDFVRGDSESWGIDFGTSGSIIAYYKNEAKCLPMRSDYTSVILQSASSGTESETYSKEKIREKGLWFMTYPNERKDRNTFVVTELVFCNQDFHLSNIPHYIPGEDYHLTSVMTSAGLLATNRLLGRLKWENVRDDETIRPARRGFLALLLLMATADRMNQHDLVPVGQIKPCLAYPLRMMTGGRERLMEDFLWACQWVEKGTGLKFSAPESISESAAASTIASVGSEVLIADLGGATLDLWMGRREESENYSADSILLAGFGLVDYYTNNFDEDIRKIIGDGEGRSMFDIKLRRFLLENPYSDVKDRFRTAASTAMKEVRSGFFALVIEYIARFASARVISNYKNTTELDIQIVTTGNGWKLNLSLDSIADINDYARERIQERINALFNEFNVNVLINVNGLPYQEKDAIAIGAARQKHLSDGQMSKRRTFSGLTCTNPPNLKWYEPIPFDLEPYRAQGKTTVEFVSTQTVRKGNKHYQIVAPPLPRYAITAEVFADLTSGALMDKQNAEIYDQIGDKLHLVAPPLGLLMERLVKSLGDHE